MFEEQSVLTRKLVAQGSAVFISRCVVHILKDHEGLISVCIGADLETRVMRMKEEQGTDGKSARSLVKEIDRGRKTYCQHYTFKTWGQREDYDLCLDADSMVAVIRAFAENAH